MERGNIERNECQNYKRRFRADRISLDNYRNQFDLRKLYRVSKRVSILPHHKRFFFLCRSCRFTKKNFKRIINSNNLSKIFLFFNLSLYRFFS